MVIESHISASSITTFDQCPLRYFAQKVLKIPEGPVHDLTKMGSAVHGMFENSVNHRIKTSEIVNEGDPMFWKLQMMDEYKVSKKLDSLIDELCQNAIDWGYFRNVENTVGCEMKVDFNLPDGTKVVGYIDRLDVKDDEIDVIDLKTQKREFTDDQLKGNWQAKIYNIGSRLLVPEATKDASVSFWVLRHRVQRVTKTRLDAEKDTLELIKKVEEIKACPDYPVGKPSGLCPWCPYYDECEYKSMGRKQLFKKGR